MADSPGHDRGWQQPAGKHRWRQDPGEGVNQDPRRTYREPPAAGLDPRRTYREASPGFDRAGAREPPAADAADDEVIVGLPHALRSRYRVLEELPNPGAEADVLLVRDAMSTGPGAAADDLRVVKVYRRNMHADQAVWAKIQCAQFGQHRALRGNRNLGRP